MRIVIDLQGAQTESRFRGIGRYSLSLAQAMARQAGDHEVWICLNASFIETIAPIRAALDSLVPPARICIFKTPLPVGWDDPANMWRMRAAEIIREDFLANLQPDVLHISSLFEGANDAATISVNALDWRSPVAVTLYDLIPLLNQETYLGDDWARRWYMDKIASLKHSRLMLSISEYARREAMDALGIEGERIVNISSAISDIFHPRHLVDGEAQVLCARYGIRHAYLMYSGAIESRKNLDRLLEAFALLPSELRERHQLVIAGKASEFDQLRLLHLSQKLGIGEHLVLTGYVPDDDLVALYSRCALFILPSLHEGFGLPALEAMACGAPTIGSNTTSIPEVIGRADALFDPCDPQAIAEKIARVLTDDGFGHALREHAPLQAARFSWDVSAKRAIEAFEHLHTRMNGPHSKTWRTVLQQRERDYPKLIDALASIPYEPVAPSDSDLMVAAVSIADNRIQADYLVRSGELPEQITWRIEGPFDSSYSLALLNRETALALDALGHHVVLHSTEGPGDFAPNEKFMHTHPDLARLHGRSGDTPPEDVDVTSRNLYPPRVADMCCRLNLLHHYAWEESGFPRDWVESFNENLQGMTCLSHHVQKIMIDHGLTVPLTVSGCGVDHWERISADVGYKVEGGSFRFLHVSSCFPRKGADVLLKAYGRAFSSADDVTLIIKTFPNPHNEIRKWLDEAKQEKLDYPNVVIIEEELTDSQLKALYKQCHALVAPSRAEGFGLPMAEAMLSGLPVLTTAWGGQLDFCTPQTAWLVNFTFKPAVTHFGLFSSVWAEPSQAHLAQTMRDVYELPSTERRVKPDRGRDLLLSSSKWKDVALRLVDSAHSFSSMNIPIKQKIGWITTWNTKCGIATYSSHLIRNMPTDVTVLAAHTTEQTSTDGPEVVRCWDAGDTNVLDELSRAIEATGVTTLVIQFQYSFFDFEKFSEFLFMHTNAGRIVTVMLHATTDPEQKPRKRLAILSAPLRCCHRVLVHAPGDLNRLKEIGLQDNVALFPHGVIDCPIPQPSLKTNQFTIASYGFFLPHKGLPQLIDALSLLVANGRDIRLKMVNAEYSVLESRPLIEKAKEKVASLGLTGRVEFISDFMADQESLASLSEADLIVFPYQSTGESSSAAVRYGLATGRPVAVTPLPIFDDVCRAVFYLPGQTSAEIAQGIGQLIDDLVNDDQKISAKQHEADQWRIAHRFSGLGQRLHNMLIGLSREQSFNIQKETGHEVKDFSNVYLECFMSQTNG